MRVPRFNRKQKVIRNLLLCLVLLFLTEWCMGFPVWSREALLHRAEDMYLLENTTRLLHDGEGWHGRPTLYAENNGQLLTAAYDKTLLGLRLEYLELYPPEVRYVMECSWVNKAGDDYLVCLDIQVMGFLEAVQRAELEVTLTEYEDSRTDSAAEKTEVRVLTAEKIGDYCLRFPVTAEADFDPMRTDIHPVILRLYDEQGELLEARIYTDYISRVTSEEGEVYEN